MIHKTAIIGDSVKFGKNVKVGAYSCLDGDLVIGDDVEIMSHVCISGNTYVGDRTKIYPFASIGFAPQDLKYKGENSKTIIGSDNTIREYVTIQSGTSQGGMQTVIGNNCLLMVSSHVAHDCVLKDFVIMANNATLGGHVEVGNHVIIGGLSAIQQFVRIGDHAIIGGMSGVEKDILPYAMVIGERAFINGVNIVGLKRRGFSNSSIHAINDAFNHIFATKSDLNFLQRVELLKKTDSGDEAVDLILKFLESDSKRHYCQPKNHEF